MKLATVRIDGATAAVRLDSDSALVLPASDVGEILRKPDWRSWAAEVAPLRALEGDLDFAPVVTSPSKILAVGLNYEDHLTETGRAKPDYPTLFSKYSSGLIGATDDIVVAAGTVQMDWEAELALVVGAPLFRATEDEAAAAIAGYSILNDTTDRGLQYRTSQWTQGKILDRTCPFGPYLLVTDDPTPAWDIECLVNGLLKQRSNTRELAFGALELLRYVSRICALQPGDVIATGTPAGVGNYSEPPEYLKSGDRLITRIAGLGECSNTFWVESADSTNLVAGAQRTPA